MEDAQEETWGGASRERNAFWAAECRTHLRCGDRLGAGDSSVASAIILVSASVDMGGPRAVGRRWGSVSEAEPCGVCEQLAGGEGDMLSGRENPGFPLRDGDGDRTSEAGEVDMPGNLPETSDHEPDRVGVGTGCM